MHFSKDVVIKVAKVKVIANKEPMVLIGADTMIAPDNDKARDFAHVGLEPRSWGGIIQFVHHHNGGRLQLCTLPLYC